jgi:proline racemase
MTNRVEGKVAIVTGAGSVGPGIGNGKAAAILYAREGAQVVLVDCNLDAANETRAIIEQEGGACFTCRADVSNPVDCRNIVEECIRVYGRLDILHNNVGIEIPGGLDTTSEEAWNRTLAVNLTGTFLICKHAVAHMEKQRSGAIINISSINAIRTLPAISLPYAVSKAGIIALTREVAVQYAAKGIRANAILPGMMNTPFVVQSLTEAYGMRSALQASKVRAGMSPILRCSSLPTRPNISRARQSLLTAVRPARFDGMNIMRIKRLVTAIDTHTAGGPTRILTGGIGPLAGGTVADKMEFFQAHHDDIRKLTMWEPRGHKGMYGAVITEPTQPRGDIGAFFLTSSGYLASCVHSSIGVVAAGLETGFVTWNQAESIVLDTPGGMLGVLPKYEDHRLSSLTVQMPPAFLYSHETLRCSDTEPIEADIMFSGVFFALVDAAQLGWSISHENTSRLIAKGTEILDYANTSLDVRHPLQPNKRSELSLVLLYEEIRDGHARDLVVNRSGSIDRSPCGAGTGALVTLRFQQDRLEPGRDYVVESLIGTHFIGQILKPASVADHPGSIPLVTGMAYVTGMHQFMLDEDDPLAYGFLL